MPELAAAAAAAERHIGQTALNVRTRTITSLDIAAA
jgi:hypothetical protein